MDWQTHERASFAARTQAQGPARRTPAAARRRIASAPRTTTNGGAQ